MKNVRIVNCTQHDINIELVDGTLLNIKPSGNIARHSMTMVERIFRIGKIPISKVIFGDVVGLPDPQPNTIYIVSLIVLQELMSSRPDVYAPGELIRTERGRVVACKGLKQI